MLAAPAGYFATLSMRKLACGLRKRRGLIWSGGDARRRPVSADGRTPVNHSQGSRARLCCNSGLTGRLVNGTCYPFPFTVNSIRSWRLWSGS
jgi:hypothetical protein